MKFIATFSWKPDAKTRDEGIARFRKTGGQPPAGVKLLGRWTRADFSGGFDDAHFPSMTCRTMTARVVARHHRD